MIPKMTGVLCCYNSAAFIEKTLNSIFQQTIPLDSLLIIDDGSNDQTVNEIRRFLGTRSTSVDSVRIIENTSNIGISRSYNLGLKECNTKYAVVFSHDDINHPNRVDRTRDAFAKGASIVCSYMKIPVEGYDIVVSDSPHVVALGLALRNRVPAATVAFDVELMEKHNLYFNPQFDYAEDYHLWCQYILKGFAFHVVPEYLVTYTHHHKQISVIKKEEQKVLAEKIRCEYIKSLFPFLEIEQSEILVKILLHQQELIKDIDRDFIDLICMEMDKLNVPEGIRALYRNIQSTLNGVFH